MQNLRVNDLDCKLRQKKANCKIIHGKKTLVQCKIVVSFQLSVFSCRHCQGGDHKLNLILNRQAPVFRMPAILLEFLIL